MAYEDEMLTVIVIENPVQQALIEDVLTDADIPYMIKSAGVQNLFGAGQLGGVNLVTGPIEIQVPRSELNRANELIALALEHSEPEDLSVEDSAFEERQEESDTDIDAGTDSPIEKQAADYSRYSAIWSVLWIGGLGSLIAIYYGIKALILLQGYPRALKTKAIFGIILGIIGLFIWLVIWNSLLRR